MPNKWTEHVKAYRAKHPGKSYKDCMMEAKKTYKTGSGTQGSGIKLAGGALKLAGAHGGAKAFNKNMLLDAAKIVVKYTKDVISGDLAKLRDNLIAVYGDKVLHGTMHTGGMYGSGLGLAGGVNWAGLWAKALTLLSQAPVKEMAKSGAAIAGKQVKKLAKKALADPEKAIDVISAGVDLGKSIKKKGVRKSGKEIAGLKELAETGKVSKTTTTTTKARPKTVPTDKKTKMVRFDKKGRKIKTAAMDQDGGFLIEFARSIAPSLLNTALEKTGLMKSFPPKMRKQLKSKAGMQFVLHGKHPKGSDLEKLQKHLMKQTLKKGKKGGALKLAGEGPQMMAHGQDGGFVITTALLISGAIAAAKAVATGAAIALGGLAIEAIADAARGDDEVKQEVEYEYVDEDGNPVSGMAGSGMMGKTVKLLRPALKEVEKTVSEAVRGIKSVPAKNVKQALTATALKSADTLVKKVKSGTMTVKEAVDDLTKKHVSKALEKELDKVTIGSGLNGECEGSMVGSGLGSLARAGLKAGVKALPKLAKKVVKRVVKVVTKAGSKASKGLKAIVKKIKPTKIKVKPPSSSGYTPSWQQQFDSVSKIPSKISKVDFSAAKELYANDKGMLDAMKSFETVLR